MISRFYLGKLTELAHFPSTIDKTRAFVTLTKLAQKRIDKTRAFCVFDKTRAFGTLTKLAHKFKSATATGQTRNLRFRWERSVLARSPQAVTGFENLCVPIPHIQTHPVAVLT